MALLVIGEVLGLVDAVSSFKLCAVDLKLKRIEDDIVEAILLVNVCGNRDGALVTEVPTKLNIMEEDCIVGGLDPAMR